ncbi:bifunctional adenosylcobinamide kinase/adenosylcobinamide-phosphate guanylyltransferase [Sulfurimonas sp.]|uniref:bifunctional adenosylcobinamide kinase/adenosylcobinamide-phosphate guanylyltransferase n=1 Tax=Sulfurimonas sp. TaxID=2022749 RepID=UPI002AAF4094|nr:bifunctional adenosylcobinamide kinase/adenosylcobinamide-phosphate guanylyltransferase [Sulfurimonas sp.]
MKALFIGGIKSGKSVNAQNYILKLSSSKPCYLATTEFIDAGIKERIKEHKKNRHDKFNTVEESLSIYKSIKANKTPVLVECVSMWINNMFHHGFNLADMKKELKKILKLEQTIVFVLNDVGSGIIPQNKLASDFIDASGIISQLISQNCDEVYHTIAGISTRIK